MDTHKDIHAAAVITVLGAVLGGRSFPATADGYGNSSTGHDPSACCDGLALNAPALAEPPWHGICAPKTSR
ncbi:hypothetical protein [Streptomyces collinus]|uniref:hypothetical protein n=1 Tax=Streptomyces collinus TaxID=42684 RepID=UPI0036A11105